jgi:Molecular chaperone
MIGHEFNENFGGSSLDYAMAEVVLNDFYSKHGIDLRNNTKSIARLLKEIMKQNGSLVQINLRP